MMLTNQTKEEQLVVMQKELLTTIETYQLSVLYLKVMLDNVLCKPDIYDYFTTFPITDVMNECRTIIDQLVDEHPNLRDVDVYGTTLGKVMNLHQDAIDIDTFMEKYLDLPIQEPVSYLKSIEDMMNCARQEFNIVEFAYWWSAWNLTKMKGSLDNSFWENRRRLTDRALFGTLNHLLDILMTKDSQGNYIYDVFKNPSTIKYLKHFIDQDDLPQA